MKDIIREKKKKFIIRISLIILMPLILCTVFGIVDYFRAINGKKPIFIYHTTNVTNFDVEMGFVVEDTDLPSKEGTTNIGIGSNVIVFEDTVLPSQEEATYYGIGYNVSICNNETGNYIFQLGGKKKEVCFSTLTCTKTFAENDKQSFDYSFFDGKVYRIYTTITIPINQIANEETYKKEFMKINDVKGCGATFRKQNDKNYVTTQICNISNMSSSDVEKVYSISKKSMEQTKTEIIDGYSHDKDMICE
jgi:hypothetical protein